FSSQTLACNRIARSACSHPGSSSCCQPAFMYLLCPCRINQTHLTPSQLKIRQVGLKVKGSNFTLEGFPFQIIAGTMHYFRMPRSYWRVNLLKLKACGFNTLTTHVPWNLHEPRVDQFVFTGNLDLMAFITIASDVGLWVILCPGPYIGSDLDLGGLPSWLLKDPKMKLRTTYKGFTNAVNRYFDKLISRIVPLQYNQGGPIIAVQVENEYGSYYLDKKYMPYVKKVSAPLIFFHIYTLLFSLLVCGGHSPIMMMVYTARSFDTWGALRNSLDPHVLMKDVHEMFKLRFSLNFYMFHGGTNFGFMGGAASLNTYLPMVTSYDYGALLTEDGEYTPEYITFQEYFSSAVGATPFERWALGRGFWGSSVQPQPSPVKSAKPVSMEVLSVNQGNGQSYGYTLYETYISKGGILSSRGHVQDRAQVGGNKCVSVAFVCGHSPTVVLVCLGQGYQDHHSLRILVENQGRLAYGKDINTQRKGGLQNADLSLFPQAEGSKGQAHGLEQSRVSQPRDTHVEAMMTSGLAGKGRQCPFSSVPQVCFLITKSEPVHCPSSSGRGLRMAPSEGRGE
uniref:Beta-galactosidase n=1 Tax=Prolemur simus TaxID=1328070 RepID=A0A8C8Z184_PROSS